MVWGPARQRHAPEEAQTTQLPQLLSVTAVLRQLRPSQPAPQPDGAPNAALARLGGVAAQPSDEELAAGMLVGTMVVPVQERNMSDERGLAVHKSDSVVSEGWW